MPQKQPPASTAFSVTVILLYSVFTQGNVRTLAVHPRQGVTYPLRAHSGGDRHGGGRPVRPPGRAQGGPRRPSTRCRSTSTPRHAPPTMLPFSPDTRRKRQVRRTGSI